MSVNIGDLAASALRKRIMGLRDNVTTHNALGNYLMKKGRMQKYRGGGRTILEDFIYGTNSSVKWFDGYEAFVPPTTDQAVIDAAEYQWKQLGGFIAISGREARLVRGKEQIHDLIKTRTMQLEANLKNTFAASLYSDGTGTGGKELGGLQLLVADDPTAAGTVGGISQSANAFWRNKYSAAAATTSATVKTRMNSMHLSIIRGKNQPDLIVCDDIFYTYYWDSLQEQVRFTQTSRADAGFGELKYKTSMVMYDDQCPEKHMYMLDTNDLFLRVIDDRAPFDVEDARKVTNADYQVVPVFAMMQLTTARRASHGVIIAS